VRNRQILLLALVVLALASVGLVRAASEESPANILTGYVQSSGREASTGEHLSRLLSPLGVTVDISLLPAEVQSYQELSISWSVPGGDFSQDGPLLRQEPATRVLAALESRKRSQPLRRDRSLELSTIQILVTAIDGKQTLRWWSLVADPRIMRAESANERGELSGTVLYRSKAEFTVAFPDDEAITELRLYHPNWTGAEFTLDLLGIIPVERGKTK
jgi:hypothetical protein